jgi:hypothetical protein
MQFARNSQKVLLGTIIIQFNGGTFELRWPQRAAGIEHDP